MMLISIGLILGLVALVWILVLATVREEDRHGTMAGQYSGNGTSRDGAGLAAGSLGWGVPPKASQRNPPAQPRVHESGRRGSLAA